MRQQLRFNAMNSRRLLQRLDDVLRHLRFDPMRIHAARRNEQVAHHTFAALIDEEGVSHDVAALDRRIARQNLGVHITQNHVRRVAIVPAKHAAPRLDFLVEQGAEVAGREMPEVENLHSSSVDATGGKR